MTARCHACGADQPRPMGFDEFVASRPTPKANAFGRIVECLFCSERLPSGKPGRPSVACSKKACRDQLAKLKAVSNNAKRKRGDS